MKTTLDELLERVNIVDIISEFVKLRRAGKNYVGLCPFHKEKTPSFSVNAEKQMFYCFGCNEGGNAVTFLMKYENLTFQEALEGLARKYGLEIEKKGQTKRSTVQDALSKLTAYYHGNLKNSRPARQYLLDRGIDDAMTEEFQLGYSDRSRFRLKEFIRSTGIPNDILLDTGIFRVKDGDTYDIFGGRIIVPIMDVNRKVIGFGGRTLEKEGLPKYINSPESPVFSKRKTLFGIDKAKREIVQKNEAIIVEGYFDLISLYGAGLRNAVSALGTSVTEEQLMRLRNYSENVTLMLDGDEAGVRSALKLIVLLSELDMNGSMVVLPEGHDPDSFIRREGADAVERLMMLKRPILDYFFDYHMEQCGLEKMEGKMAFIKKVMPHVENIRDNIKKRLYVKRLSELTGVEELHFGGRISWIQAEPAQKKNQSTSIIGRRIIDAVINNPVLLDVLKSREVIGRIKEDDVREVLVRMCEHYDKRQCLDIQAFVDSLENGELKEFVLNSVFAEFESDEENQQRVVWDYVHHLERESVLQEARRITERLLEAEKRGDDTAVAELLGKKRQILATMKSSLVK